MKNFEYTCCNDTGVYKSMLDFQTQIRFCECPLGKNMKRKLENRAAKTKLIEPERLEKYRQELFATIGVESGLILALKRFDLEELLDSIDILNCENESLKLHIKTIERRFLHRETAIEEKKIQIKKALENLEEAIS